MIYLVCNLIVGYLWVFVVGIVVVVFGIIVEFDCIVCDVSYIVVVFVDINGEYCEFIVIIVYCCGYVVRVSGIVWDEVILFVLFD